MGLCEYLSVASRTVKRDQVALFRYLQLLRWIRRFQGNNLTVPMVFEQFVKKHPNKVALIHETTEWTFQQIDELSNRIAHIFEDAGFKPGDTVSLLLDNRAEYAAIWLGLAKAGLVTALINFNLKGKPLCHSIQIVDSKAVIFGADFTDALSEVRDQLDASMPCYVFDLGQQAAPSWSRKLDDLLAAASSEPLAGAQRVGSRDKMLYIYTSGTTGLPKAAVIRHYRYTFFTCGIQYMTQLQTDDILYITLPLYHSAGGMTAMGQTLLFGHTSVIRKKFSASAFWVEASRHKCTVAIYIGEICRYLLAAPERPEEKTHKLRMMYGNGMRPQIWKEFVQRFNIPLIAELYGATEGISNIINFEGVVGAVGFVSMIAPSVYPVGIIRVDENGEPIRGKDGLCIRCKPGEPGMFIGMIVKDHAVRNFDGYADTNATKKKVTCDVFRRGDAAFLSGDILEMDELGYLYFKDRTGDTFRWRGENVSTTEVEAVVSNVAGLKDCAVYGVEVPGSEGRAGMAAILDPERTLDLKALYQGLVKVLPSYARPLFVRTIATIDMTGTYKMRKVDYQREGFDPAQVQDGIYLLDAASQSYVPFTSDLYEKLKNGELRL